MTESKDIILPSGQKAKEAMQDPAEQTKRKIKRRKEDEEYIPVIIKRIDDTSVHPDDMLEHAIEEGIEQLDRPVQELFLSAMAAGLILGFSAMAVAVVSEAVAPGISEVIQRLAVAFVYPLGFIICILSGTQLFTEHTATAVYPLLERRASFQQIVHLWATVLGGNLIGTFISAVLLNAAGDVISANEGYMEIAHHLTHFSTPVLLISAILAGWLMAQGAWLLLGARSQSARILSIYLVTFLIGIGGLHHSIAGSAEMFLAVLVSDKYGWLDAFRFITVAVAGNMIGGSTFVAVLNYAQIRRSQLMGKKTKD